MPCRQGLTICGSVLEAARASAHGASQAKRLCRCAAELAACAPNVSPLHEPDDELTFRVNVAVASQAPGVVGSALRSHDLPMSTVASSAPSSSSSAPSRFSCSAK